MKLRIYFYTTNNTETVTIPDTTETKQLKKYFRKDEKGKLTDKEWDKKKEICLKIAKPILEKFGNDVTYISIPECDTKFYEANIYDYLM